MRSYTPEHFSELKDTNEYIIYAGDIFMGVYPGDFIKKNPERFSGAIGPIPDTFATIEPSLTKGEIDGLQRCDNYGQDFYEAEDGEWVRFSDLLSLLKSKQQ